MSVTTAGLRADPGSSVDLEAVVGALTAGFEVSVGSAAQVRRRRLDTFDRRLGAARMVLEHRTVRSTVRLVVTAGDEGVVAESPVRNARFPSKAEGLPAGQVRDLVGRVTGIRALLSLGEEIRMTRRIELRNRDAKIVCRLDIAESAGDRSPLEVTFLPLRGYADEARRARRSLTALGLKTVGSEPERPGGAAEAELRFRRSDPAAVLLAQEMTGFLGTIRANLPGLVEDLDTEFLHDVRVAVRRTRATLKLGRPALAPELLARWEPEFKRLGDLTTPLRDLDVYELDLPVMTGWLVAAQPDDLRPFAALLRRRRRAARGALLRALRSPSFDQLLTEWDAALAELVTSAPVGDQLPARELAGRSIGRKFRQVTRLGAAITEASPPSDLHELRKRLKELRYAIEVFAPVVAGTDRRPAISDVKQLQDVLGRYQDAEVQRHRLRSLAGELLEAGATAPTMLAMGELVAHLEADQARARAGFGHAYKRFTRPASLQRFRRLEGRR